MINQMKLRRIFGWVLAGSMGITVLLLILEGRWREALPLHLCSISALLAFALAFGNQRWAMDFLWYLGMPGALLALVFPAPALCRVQGLFNACYYATHLLILLIPAIAMTAGLQPRRGKGLWMMMVVQGIALAAYGVNRLLQTDFLFLMAPPLHTPLEAVFQMGYPVYLIVLETLVLLLVTIMERVQTLSDWWLRK